MPFFESSLSVALTVKDDNSPDLGDGGVFGPGTVVPVLLRFEKPADQQFECSVGPAGFEGTFDQIKVSRFIGGDLAP